MLPRRRPAIATVLALLLASTLTGGCTLVDEIAPLTVQSDDAAVQDGDQDEDAADGDTTESDAPVDEPDATEEDQPGPDALGDPCAEDVQQAVGKTIGAQLDAFVDRDFAAALAFATPAFQSQFSPTTFGQLIVREFPVAADATSHDVTDCREISGFVSATVVVTADIGSQLLEYGLRQIGGVWLIDGAVPRGSAEGQVV